MIRNFPKFFWDIFIPKMSEWFITNYYVPFSKRENWFSSIWSVKIWKQKNVEDCILSNFYYWNFWSNCSGYVSAILKNDQHLRLYKSKLLRSSYSSWNYSGMQDRFIFWLQILVFLEYFLIYDLYDRIFVAAVQSYVRETF